MRPDELHQAIYDALNVTSVTNLLSTSHAVNPIYTVGAPQVANAEDPALFPYITFSFPADAGFTDKDTNGGEATVQIDIWHRTASELALKPIANAVYAVLQRQPLAGLTGHITTECVGMAFDSDPDGKTKRGMLEFRVLSLG